MEVYVGGMRSCASLWLAKPWYLCPGPNAGKRNLRLLMQRLCAVRGRLLCGVLLLVALGLHVLETKLLLFLLCALVLLDLNLRVWLGRSEALDVTAGKRVLEDDCELLLAVNGGAELVE